MAKPFQHIDVSFEDIEALSKNNPASSKKLNDFIKYWKAAQARGVKKTVLDFGKTPEGIWTGKWHRQLDNTDIEFMTAVLRYHHCNSKTLYSQYELDFIQGIEDIARSCRKRNNKQGWQLGMILEEKIV